MVAHAVILAAGEGKRLRPFTLAQPKCFARVGGLRILDNALAALAQHGCVTVTVVVGHLAHVIRETIGPKRRGMNIAYVENSDYAITNSMYSLALGLRTSDEACWVIEGDVFFESAVLGVSSSGEIVWFVDSSRRDLDGAYVESHADGIARSLSIIRDLKQIRPKRSKSVGMLRLTREGRRMLLDWLEAGIAKQRTNDYYDLIIGDRLAACDSVHTADVAGLKWFEIDASEDLAAAETLFGSFSADRA